MRDLNFFEDYIKKDQFKIDKKIICFALSIFLVLFFCTYSLYNHILIKQETSVVNNLKSVAENPELLSKIDKIQERKIEVSKFKDSVGRIRELNQIIESKDIINELLLDSIISIMPGDLFLTSIGIKNDDIQLVGIAGGKRSIAEFEKGLEMLENVEEIFVSNISLQEDFYNFNVNIIMGDVSIDGKRSEKIQD